MQPMETIMDHAAPVEVDAHELERALNFWNKFTTLVKYSIIAIVCLLIGMALFLL
jgi:hypothetical protein